MLNNNKTKEDTELVKNTMHSLNHSLIFLMGACIIPSIPQLISILEHIIKRLKEGPKDYRQLELFDKENIC